MSSRSGPTLQLFGLPRLMDCNGLAISVRGRKSIALLGYLVLTYPQVHSREHLAGLFWPELNDKDARNNLRVALARITKNLGSPDIPVLVTDRLKATFNPAASLSCDAREFLAHLRSVSVHSHDDQLTCGHCFSTLARALGLYAADFMEGFFLQDCEEFGVWQHDTREHLRVSAIAMLSTQGQYAALIGDFSGAEQLTRQLLTMDPYKEEAHRRLMTVLAQRGEHHAAIAHYSQMKTRLHDDLGVEPDDVTQAVFFEIENGDLKADAGLDSITKNIPAGVDPPQNLPIEKSKYIGNRSTLEELTTHIRERRLVTLTGIGGVGKTRLAVQAGRDLLPGFPGGVWFLRLAPLNTRTEMLSSLASTLRVELLPGDEPITSIANQLDAQRRLLILDNFEHLLDARDIVSSLLELANSLTILVTTRQRLQLTEEAVFPLQGLAYGGSEQFQSDTHESDDDAAELFIDSARRTRLNFKVSESNRGAIHQIAHLVKGHPLALVIAASWVDVLACREIAEEIERGLEILETESSDVPERQRSVRATFNYSWTLLGDEEQRIFTALSSFRGGFDKSAALQVAGATLIQLTRLVRKSLLQHYPEQDRYDMHELMRQYAEEQLQTLGVSRTVTKAHSKYYLSVLNEMSSNQIGVSDKRCQEQFNADFDNIRKAWYFALADEQHQQLTGAISGLRLMCSLGAHSHVLLDLLQPALPLIANPDKDQSQKDLVLNLLLALGFAYRYTKGYFAPELDDIFARAYALTDDLKTSPELFVVLYGRWSFNFTRGHLVENLAIISQWRARLSQLDENSGPLPYIRDAEFVVNMLEGPQLQSMGEITSARKIMKAGLELEDITRYSAMVGSYGLNFAVSGRHWLAINQCVAGLLVQSEGTIARAREIAVQAHNPYLRIFVAFGELIIYTIRKDVRQIHRHAETVNTLVTEHRIFEAFQHHAKIYTQYANNCVDGESGIEQMQLLIDSGKGIPIFRIFDTQLVAESMVRAGMAEQAIELIDASIIISEQRKILINSAEGPRVKGDAMRALGDSVGATHCYKKAITIAEQQQAGLYQLRSGLAYAVHLVTANENKEAKALLEPIVNKLIECRKLIDFSEAQELLASLKSP